MTSKLEPAIWSRDTGQWTPCFDRCQLTVTWMLNIREGRYKARVHVSVNLLADVWAPFCWPTRALDHSWPAPLACFFFRPITQSGAKREWLPKPRLGEFAKCLLNFISRHFDECLLRFTIFCFVTASDIDFLGPNTTE